MTEQSNPLLIRCLHKCLGIVFLIAYLLAFSQIDSHAIDLQQNGTLHYCNMPFLIIHL